MLGIDGHVLSRSHKIQILTVVLQNCKKSTKILSIRKPTLLYFVDFSTVFCPKLQCIVCLVPLIHSLITLFHGSMNCQHNTLIVGDFNLNVVKVDPLIQNFNLS